MKNPEASNDNAAKSSKEANFPLLYTWVLWKMQPGDKAANWTGNLQRVDEFSDVKDFWLNHDANPNPSALLNGADYYLFRDTIQPNWEDPMNKGSGRWQVTITRELAKNDPAGDKFDTGWVELKKAVIGAQFGENNDKICGIVASCRIKKYRLALWISDPAKETRDAIGLVLEEKLKGIAGNLNFEFHDRADFHSSANQLSTSRG